MHLHLHLYLYFEDYDLVRNKIVLSICSKIIADIIYLYLSELACKINAHKCTHKLRAKVITFARKCN